MKHFITRTSAMLLVATIGHSVGHGQDQIGTQLVNVTSGFQNQMTVTSVKLKDFVPDFNAAPVCDSTFMFSTVFAPPYNGNDPANEVYWNTPSTDDPANWASMPTANGDVEFTLEIHFTIFANTNVVRQMPLTWDVFIDDVECVDCAVETTSIQNMWCGTGSQIGIQNVRVVHQQGNAWNSPMDGRHKFTLRPVLVGDAYNCTNICCAPLVFGECICGFDETGWQDHSASVVAGVLPEIRFMAVMEGTVFSEILDEFETPALPVAILRAPPGDLSYSEWTTSTTHCFGSSMSVNTGSGQTDWAKIKMNIPFFELYGESSFSMSTNYDVAEGEDWETCVNSTQTYRTVPGGLPDDVFVGSAMRYGYGYATHVSREEGTCAVQKSADLALVPLQSLAEYNLTESYIRDHTIPDLEDLIAVTTPGTSVYDNLVKQLDVWEQTLALNDSIKATADLYEIKNFSTGVVVDDQIETTSTQSRSIEYSTQLQTEIGGEVGFSIFGIDLSGGETVHMRSGYGHGETSSNATVNTMTYHLEDDDAGAEFFRVKVKTDPVFGTYVFELDPANSKTSCPYEGGYQLDQPELFVGNFGQSTLELSDVPNGTNAIYPIIACNNSSQPRTYHLELNSQSNPLGAIISGYNGITSSSFVSLTIPAGDCLPVANLYLSQYEPTVLDYTGIEVVLVSACGDGDNPCTIDECFIASTITIGAHFNALSTGTMESAGPVDDWFSVQPNPSSGIFQLKPLGVNAPINITVIDGTGRSVKAPFQIAGPGTVTMDLGDVAAGMYHMIATSEGEQRSMKLMVQH